MSVAAELRGREILDYGSGTSPYRTLFDGFERTVTADLPGHGAELDVVDGRIPVDNESFDAVLSTQVLEHVEDPGAYLLEARRVLRKGGTLILSTHGHYRYHPDPDDFWRWTEPGLRLQVARAGFVIDRVEGVVSGLGAALTMTSQYLAAILPRALRPIFHAVAQSVISAIERVADKRQSPDAAVYVVVAKIPGTALA